MTFANLAVVSWAFSNLDIRLMRTRQKVESLDLPVIHLRLSLQRVRELQDNPKKKILMLNFNFFQTRHENTCLVSVVKRLTNEIRVLKLCE